MIKIFTLLFTASFIILLGGCSMTDRNEIDTLREMNKLSKEYKEISLNCLVEMKLKKREGWESQDCKAYQAISRNALKQYSYDVKNTTAAFTRYVKTQQVSEQEIKEGLRYLFIIETNLNTIKDRAKIIQLSLKN